MSVALNEIKNSESSAFLHHYPMLPLEAEICMLVVQHTLLVLCGIIFLLATRKICLCANILLLHKEAQVGLLRKGRERSLNVVFNRQFWAQLKATVSSFFCVPNLEYVFKNPLETILQWALKNFVSHSQKSRNKPCD